MATEISDGTSPGSFNHFRAKHPDIDDQSAISEYTRALDADNASLLKGVHAQDVPRVPAWLVLDTVSNTEPLSWVRGSRDTTQSFMLADDGSDGPLIPPIS